MHARAAAPRGEVPLACSTEQPHLRVHSCVLVQALQQAIDALARQGEQSHYQGKPLRVPVQPATLQQMIQHADALVRQRKRQQQQQSHREEEARHSQQCPEPQMPPAQHHLYAPRPLLEGFSPFAVLVRPFRLLRHTSRCPTQTAPYAGAAARSSLPGPSDIRQPTAAPRRWPTAAAEPCGGHCRLWQLSAAGSPRRERGCSQARAGVLHFCCCGGSAAEFVCSAPLSLVSGHAGGARLPRRADAVCHRAQSDAHAVDVRGTCPGRHCRGACRTRTCSEHPLCCCRAWCGMACISCCIAK